MGHASDSGEDLPEWNRLESEFEGFDDLRSGRVGGLEGGFQGVSGMVSRGSGGGGGV